LALRIPPLVVGFARFKGQARARFDSQVEGPV